jgi:hypothetical protein
MGVAVLPDWGAILGPLWVPILAGSPLEAPDGLKVPIAPTSAPPRGQSAAYGPPEGLAGPSQAPA